MSRCRVGGGITLILALFFLTQTAYAQDDDGDDDFSDFGGFDDAEGSDDFDDFGDFGADGSDDFDDFGAVGESSGSDEVFGLPTISGLIVPSEALAGPLAEQLTKELNKELSELVGYEAKSNEAIDEQFEIMGEELAAECAFDPVCMGRVGRDSGIDLIVVGRVEATDSPGRWGTTLDLIDAGEGQIDNFVYFMTASRTVSVQEDLHKQLYRLLRIREEKSSGVTKEKGRAQRAVGWTALALGVAAIGTGAYFTYDYVQQQNDFKASPWVSAGARDPATKLPVLDMTQKEGQALIDEMNKSRNLSYALYGAGVGVALTGAILLAVSPGKDIYDTYDSRDRNARRRLTVAPVFTPGGMGVQSGLEF